MILKNKSISWISILGIFIFIIIIVLLIFTGRFSTIFSFSTGGSWILFIWFLLAILFFLYFWGILSKIKFFSQLFIKWFLIIYFVFSLFILINFGWQLVPLESLNQNQKIITTEETPTQGASNREETIKEACDKAVVEGSLIIVPGEIGELSEIEQWSVAGHTGRVGAHCSGELYMGIGNVTARYTVDVADAGKYTLWIRTSDDAQHPVGSRAVTITVNQQKASWTDNGESYSWKWFKIGEFNLNKGENTIVFLKNETTSAAFVMDEFILSKDLNYVPH